MIMRCPSHGTPPRTAPGHAKRAASEGCRPFDGVREGGVEPPRPCGHWNLNPARLPIPPPAHWVCLRALAPGGGAPSDTRTLARWSGWIHIPFPGTGPTGHDVPPPVAVTSPPGVVQRPRLLHVSTSYRSSPSPQEQDGVHSRVRDTGPRPPLRSMAERRARARHEEPEGGAAKGASTARRHRRPGGQGEPADRAARGYDQ